MIFIFTFLAAYSITPFYDNDLYFLNRENRKIKNWSNLFLLLMLILILNMCIFKNIINFGKTSSSYHIWTVRFRRIIHRLAFNSLYFKPCFSSSVYILPVLGTLKHIDIKVEPLPWISVSWYQASWHNGQHKFSWKTWVYWDN